MHCALSPLRITATTLMALLSLNGSAAEPVVEAERIFREFAGQSGAPGISISVGRCDRIVWSDGFGFADIEQQVPVDPAATKFRTGSVAKPMTALALAKLATQGRLDLDAAVHSLVPHFPHKAHAFTVRQLAAHLAGIRHYRGDEAYSRNRYSSVDEALAIFKDDPLVAVPGEQWNYSSYGYNLLSAVIESASGKPFLTYMEEAILAPIGMRDTVPDHIDRIIPGRGRYYVRRGGVVHNEPEVDNSNKWASGGFLSTTDDLARFGLAHFDDRHVSAYMRNLLWTEQRTADGAGSGYGLGWRIVSDADENRWIGHGGGSIGGTSQFWLFPGDQLVIASAANLTELDYGTLLPQLRELFISVPAAERECHPKARAVDTK
ncbi:serine hydrolase domain-containing protein [Pseudomarimonas arenosa]|uniref:Beta-lactamase family protein n=1 Tax=Pseudomarimonas arenosa TaxID=2774145 RepID=A0AAW3ZEK9_9GAMM|nr:serine hydrolase domain-containing protein [Pseudomarimonas arenosa]MBD8524608.1 beta-lactamase family protein [Pseudomarimonas arenosa]